MLHPFRLFGKRHGEPEGTARPRLASHPDLAVHQLYQLLGDGKAQPRAPVAARRGGVGLGEGLEEACLLLCGHAYASVPHLKAQYRCLRRIFEEPDVQDDLSLIGKLIALPSRLVRICLSHPGSPRSSFGTSYSTRLASSKPLA